jgi:hypothetical protein
MSVQVTVTLGDDGLVAVKRASTDAEVERLRAEAYRLRRAGHPGVVSLVRHQRAPGGEELHLRYAGDPVERWRGTLAQAAGLSAAVAATLADLHDLGLVHGRLDPSHVLVGPDGRPRLCGLSDPGDASAADDVAAVGRLVETLLGGVAEPRKGPFAWPGGQSGDRKALSRVIARALDPDPARRPSARALATSILTAVRGAELPPRTGETPAVTPAPEPFPAPEPTPAPAATAEPQPAPDVPAGSAGDEDVWRIGTPARWPALARTGARGAPGRQEATAAGPTPTGERGDAGQEAPATVEPSATDESIGGREDAWGSMWSLDPATSIDADFLAWDRGAADSAGAPGNGPAVAVATAPGEAPGATFGEGTAPDDGSALDAWLAWSVSAGLERPLPRPEPAAADDAPPAAPTGARRRADVTGPVPLPRLGDQPRPGDGTREWSRQRLREPDDDEPTTPAGRHRRVLAGAAAAGVLGVGVAAGALTLTRQAGTAPAHEAAAACARVAEPAADVDGDGCPEKVTVDGNRVSAGEATWELGRPGDVVAVGDWDCDGAATSALLRPGTGDVFVFAGWSDAGAPVTVTPTRSVPGGVGLRVDERSGGCDALVVESADGAGTVVEEARA